jgi:L-alanine-DL-glutamate epimerase-like enolase superfamily enzyme
MTTLMIAAGEQYSGVGEFERLAVEGKVDVLQPDISRCGGLTVARQVADLATRRQVHCVPHAWLSDILKAASLHLNAYLMDSLYLEYNMSSAPMLRDLCVEPVQMQDGWVRVPDGVGLGVTVNEDVVRKHRVL